VVGLSFVVEVFVFARDFGAAAGFALTNFNFGSALIAVAGSASKVFAAASCALANST
jgi:hypothetical protein